MALNKVISHGYTCHALESRVNGETTTLFFTLAIRRNFKNGKGVYETDMIPFTAFDSKAKLLNGMEKGTQLEVEAVQRSYETADENGEIEYKVSNVVTDVYFTDRTKNHKKTKVGEGK